MPTHGNANPFRQDCNETQALDGEKNSEVRIYETPEWILAWIQNTDGVYSIPARKEQAMDHLSVIAIAYPNLFVNKDNITNYYPQKETLVQLLTEQKS